MVNISFQNIDKLSTLTTLGEISARATFEYLELAKNKEASIMFCDDNTMKTLNKDHRSVADATDVLSFPNQSSNPESGVGYLGDIAISVERAKDQAEKAGHSMEAEIQLLVVHGLLHLIGYDHNDEAEKTIMWDAQNKILDRLDNNIDRGKIGLES